MDRNLIIAIITPFLITVGGLITWAIKSKKEESLNREEKSRQYKIDTYNTLLEPFIATLTNTIPQKKKNREIQKITTLEYKTAVFNLTTFGSDETIRIFTKIMQTFFHSSDYEEDDGEMNSEYGTRLLVLISDFLLQIRKDIYSKRTKLKRSEMLEFMITDMENTRNQIDNYKY